MTDENVKVPIEETTPVPDVEPAEDPEEGPPWAHGTRGTNPHWPYEGPAEGWIEY